jgi:hypothetical protein
MFFVELKMIEHIRSALRFAIAVMSDVVLFAAFYFGGQGWVVNKWVQEQSEITIDQSDLTWLEILGGTSGLIVLVMFIAIRPSTLSTLIYWERSCETLLDLLAVCSERICQKFREKFLKRES